MQQRFTAAAAGFMAALTGGTAAMAAPSLHVIVDGITPKGPIPEIYALCKSTENGKSAPGDNLRPTISWSNVPKGTKSFAVVVSDPDVPVDFSKAGQEGEVIATHAKRQMFYHWALFDIPAMITSIPGGRASAAMQIGISAANDLGSYVPDPHSYGGPCPPWNDARIHHYHFQVFALDTANLAKTLPTTAKGLAAALARSPHVLARGEVVGTYTLNPDLQK